MVALWLVTALFAVLVGIWLGIAAAQSDYRWGSALFGWVIFLIGLWQLITGTFDYLNIRYWFIWFQSLVYPLFLLFSGLYAAWMTRLSGQLLASLLLVGAATAISTLVTIPVSWMRLNAGALWLQGLILINLSFSAALGWCLSLWLVSHS